MRETLCHRLHRPATFWISAGFLALILIGACRHPRPIFDTTPPPSQTDGTISGIVRGPDNSSSIVGRTVEVINVATGERQRTITNSAGGFTFKLAPGRYRVELTLLEGETILKRPDIINLDRSDVDAHADFVVGSSSVSRPRAPKLRSDDGLGAPIA